MAKNKYEKISEGSYGVYRKKKEESWPIWVGGFLLFIMFLGFIN